MLEATRDESSTATRTPTVPAPRRLSVVTDLPPGAADPLIRLMSDEVREDPYPFLEDLRGRGRVVRARTALLTAHHDVCALVLADPGTFSSAHRPAELAHHGLRGLDAGDVASSSVVLATDPPDHTRLRHLVGRAFDRRSVETLRPDVEGLADGLLDGLAGESASDLVADYAQPLAAMVAGEVLGVPSVDWPQLRAWADDLLVAGESRTAPARRDSKRSLHALRRYLDDLLVSRAADPGDALVDGMLQPVEEGDGLSLREAGATALLLLRASYETAATLIGNGIDALARHPDQVEVLLARPELWPAAVDEVVRWSSPVSVVTRRAVADTHLCGTAVPHGSQVVLSVAGANRDPAVFAHPDRFDVERDDAGRHLGLGGGLHACIGALLGTLQADIALRRLLSRFPNLRLAGDAVRSPTPSVRGFNRLPVRLGRHAGD